jgi:hypothetical protein
VSDAAIRAVDRKGSAGPIDEQFLAWPVLLSQDHILLLLPLPVKLAETAVAIAVRILFAVLLPKQFQGQLAMLLALVTERGEVRQRTLGRFGSRWSRREQCGFQAGFVPLFGQRPAHPCGVGFGQILMNGALTDVDAPGDLPLAEFLLVVQPENFSDFAHGLPLSGQSGNRPPGRPIIATVLSRAASALLPFRSAFSADSDQCSPDFDHRSPRREKVIGLPGEC